MGLVLLILLLLVLLGGLPSWGYWGPNGSPYGYWPSGLGIVLLVVLLVFFLVPGRLAWY